MMTKQKNQSDNREAHRAQASNSESPCPIPDRSGPVGLVPKLVSDELFQLQLEQFRHDEIYHREISRLTVHHRINHMALHFSKYSGQIAELYDAPDDASLEQTITDTFIIGLCSANTLNMRIADQIDECGEVSVRDMADLGAALAKTEKIKNFDPLWFLKTMAIWAGRMAKGCESIDHLESFPFNEHIKESVTNICKTALIAASLQNIDLSRAVRTRLAGVKERLIFHEY